MACCRIVAITRTDVDLSLVGSSDNHLRQISQEIPRSNIKIILKITHLKFLWNNPEASELKWKT